MCNVKKKNKQTNKQPEIREHVLHTNERWLLRMSLGFFATLSTTKPRYLFRFEVACNGL